MTDADLLRAEGGLSVTTSGEALTVELKPFAVARIDGRFAG